MQHEQDPTKKKRKKAKPKTAEQERQSAIKKRERDDRRNEKRREQRAAERESRLANDVSRSIFSIVLRFTPTSKLFLPCSVCIRTVFGISKGSQNFQTAQCENSSANCSPVE